MLYMGPRGKTNKGIVQNYELYYFRSQYTIDDTADRL